MDQAARMARAVMVGLLMLALVIPGAGLASK
jgi:hypothetical protein